MPIPLGVLAVAGAGAAGGADYVRLQTTILTSVASSVTFSSLDSYSSYKHLQVRMSLRNEISGTGSDSLRMRVNGVTSSVYAEHHLRGTGSAVQSGGNISSTSMRPSIAFIKRAGSIANTFGAGVLDILDFSNSSNNKTFRLFVGEADTASSTQIGLGEGLFQSTNPITSIEFTTGAGGENFSVGCRFSLYGIR